MSEEKDKNIFSRKITEEGMKIPFTKMYLVNTQKIGKRFINEDKYNRLSNRFLKLYEFFIKAEKGNNEELDEKYDSYGNDDLYVSPNDFSAFVKSQDLNSNDIDDLIAEANELNQSVADDGSNISGMAQLFALIIGIVIGAGFINLITSRPMLTLLLVVILLAIGALVGYAQKNLHNYFIPKKDDFYTFKKYLRNTKNSMEQ
ncbi:hypothetical protein [Apilactobacillus ozensis]|uniref:hypothetical protein n=1 Tax=Apilactobacillus ozensis TaxID=866801 RepID=UPI002009FFD9|nr:hypothetical protein [Apilactobacillus ozensis]MCK8607236.1 hypothetical protein [Apilactobacillus ozensis]